MIGGSHSGAYEEFNLLRYNAVCSVESQEMFRRKTSSPSSGCGSASYLFYSGLLLGLFFYPEVVGDIFARNVGWLFNRLNSFMSQKICLQKKQAQ
jgi:hypothetical protein